MVGIGLCRAHGSRSFAGLYVITTFGQNENAQHNFGTESRHFFFLKTIDIRIIMQRNNREIYYYLMLT